MEKDRIYLFRTIHPVGQGGFYTERFKEISSLKKKSCNVVYDCGSDTGKAGNGISRYVQREIDSVFSKNEKIDIVFISHLDNDHINGVEYLMREHDVRNICIPLLNSNEKLLALVKCAVEGLKETSFVYKFILDPVESVRGLPKPPRIIFVSPLGENFENRERSILSINQFSDNLKTGNQIVLENSESIGIPGLHGKRGYFWIYLPVNLDEAELSEKLEGYLNEEKIPVPANSEEIKMLLKKRSAFKKLKAFYQALPHGGINAHSMMVYSGPCEEDSCRLADFRRLAYPDWPSRLYAHFYYEKLYRYPKYSGCMYTGDFAVDKIKWSRVKTYCAPLTDHVGVLQIPHHGSRHNYDPCMLKSNPVCFISAGRSNKYGHPDRSVMEDVFMETQAFPLLVTESRWDQVNFIYEIEPQFLHCPQRFGWDR